MTFRFLNATRELSFPAGWQEPVPSRLWVYNLHYFEDLVADGAAGRRAWHDTLIDRWVVDNPPFSGTGWESYPVSLRIGNWIKWALAGSELKPAWLESLALQAEFLSRRIEWHLMANHLFENAKALTLAGMYFKGRRAEKWLKKGWRILDAQLDEQLLADGGHFERSPMYHGLVLEGLLDLIQVSEHFGMAGDRTSAWRERAGRMVAWLRTMTHPDGEISFFNDAAFDIALPPAVLAGYAEKLGVIIPETEKGDGIQLLEDSGYVRVQRGPMVALLDTAPVGPDYQPGHAHADTLSFELSMFGCRVLVNSGVSGYGLGEERNRQRGTAAHNTVVVDGENSSEVWSGFRVARRARPLNISIRGLGECWHAKASHDGYTRLPGQVVHQRTWSIIDMGLLIEDAVVGKFDHAISYLHFHPDVKITMNDNAGTIFLWNGESVDVSVIRGMAEIMSSTYHPEFGVSIDGHSLRIWLCDGMSKVVIGPPGEGVWMFGLDVSVPGRDPTCFM